ncbi:lectin subunit alpha-like [Culex pipiens pallens]|uniref:lectin subunit alpha-like n=1 Tax=Culex pipiens pallens TaxID=42434 RepID=UPI00195491D0|nr:lectin subunit alpha-like [Culex pipiens pallens]
MRVPIVLLLLIVQLVIGVKRYFIPNLKANWYKASEFCNSQDMALASVESVEKHQSLVKFIESTDKFSNASRFWLGGSDLAEEGTFVWAPTGRLVTFAAWAENEPNNVNGTENCIEIIHNTYVNIRWQWNDHDCRGFTTYFVCESVTDRCIEPFR